MWRPDRVDEPDRPAARAARAVAAAATAVVLLIVTRCRPWMLFAREGYTADFYDEQARSFLRLRLAVRPEVTGIEGFVVDGATQLYYGPFLALVRLPTALVDTIVEAAGGDPWFAGRLARLSIVLGFMAWCAAAFHLLRAARRWFRVDGEPLPPWRAAAFVGAVACSPALFLAGWVSVYHETEMWAAVFALWAAVGVVRLIDATRDEGSPFDERRAAILVGAALAAAVLTRASVGIGAIAGAIGAFAVAALASRSRSRRPMVPKSWLLAIAAALAGFVLHVATNLARFGSPLSIPAEQQQLTLVDPTRAEWFAGNNGSFFSLRFLPTTLVHYLRPDTVRFERLIPGVRFGPLATDRGSYPMETITPAASITATATVLCIAGVIGLVLCVRRRAWVWLALWTGACVAAVPTFTIGFIGNRYLADMLPALATPAAVAFAVFAVPQGWRRIARITVVIGVVWGLWANTALAIWTQQLKEPGFTSARYRVDGRFFGDPAPGLITTSPGRPVPRDGVVGVEADADGACTSVSIAEQGVWVPLERSGPAVLSGVIAAGGERLATGTGWMLVLDGERLTLNLDGADPVTGTIDVRVGDTITIVDDRLTGQFLVRLGNDPVRGDIALFRFGSFDGAVTVGDGLAVGEQPSDSLCRALEARR
jgi:hypothetical protein